MSTKLFLICVCWLAFSVSGCVGEQAFTKMARRGDTVTLALGGSPRHEINGHVDKNNMQVRITDSAEMTYDVNLRYLLKLYSDPTSRYNYNSTYDKEVSNWLGRFYIDPNQGLWVAVVDLTYPGTSTPLPLAEGPATFKVITPDLMDTRQAFSPAFPNTDGHLSQIPIEILPDTGVPSVPGSPHDFNFYGDPIDLEPLPQILIRFDNSAIVLPYPDDMTKIGAIEFQLEYDTNYFTDNKFPPMILAYINEQRISLSYRHDASQGFYKVMLFPQNVGNGILASDADFNYLKTKIKDVKVVVAWDPDFVSGTIDSDNYDQVFQIPISGYRVVDKNGVPLTDGSGGPLITLVTEPRID